MFFSSLSLINSDKREEQVTHKPYEFYEELLR